MERVKAREVGVEDLDLYLCKLLTALLTLEKKTRWLDLFQCQSLLYFILCAHPRFGFFYFSLLSVIIGVR